MTSPSETTRPLTCWPGSGGELQDLNQLHISDSPPESDVVEVPPKRTRTLEKSTARGGIWGLHLVSKHYGEESKNRNSTQWIEASPWLSYEKIYRIELGGSVAIARKPNTKEQFIVKSVSTADDQLRLIRRLLHRNLVIVRETFRFEGAFYIVSEHMAISLSHVVACPKSPSEEQLASIAEQCLCGILYIVSQGLTYTEITCSNILLSFDGVAKIANLENCRPSNGEAMGKHEVAALGRVMMNVMNKRLKSEGNFGVQDPDLWSTEAIEFLSMTLDATAEELMSHSFLKRAREEDLPWFVIYTLRTARVIVGNA